MDSKRRLKIKTLDDKVFALECPCDVKCLLLTAQILISELRKNIAAVTQIVPAQQRLIYKARLLKDDMKLSEVVKEDNEIIHLIARTEPPPSSSPPSTSTSAPTSASASAQASHGAPATNAAQSQPGQEGGFFVGSLGDMLNQMLPLAQNLSMQFAAAFEQNLAQQNVATGPRPASPQQPSGGSGTPAAPAVPASAPVQVAGQPSGHVHVRMQPAGTAQNADSNPQAPRVRSSTIRGVDLSATFARAQHRVCCEQLDGSTLGIPRAADAATEYHDA
jgi:hypothetical protein